MHNHRNLRMQLANRSSETFAFLPFCVFPTHPRLGWGKSRFPLECWPHSLLVEKRPSIYIWVDMTPKSEKIGKICTFFFIHPYFCVVNFAKQGDFTSITIPPSQGSKRKREQVSSPKIGTPSHKIPSAPSGEGKTRGLVYFRVKPFYFRVRPSKREHQPSSWQASTHPSKGHTAQHIIIARFQAAAYRLHAT